MKNLLYLADELEAFKGIAGQDKIGDGLSDRDPLHDARSVRFLAFYVFPKLVPVFSGMNVKLPLTTQLLLSTLSFVESDGLYVLLGLIILIIAIRIILKKSSFVKYVVDRTVLMIPVLSDMSRDVNVVNFTRVFGLLLKSGVKIVEALTITSATFENLVYRGVLLDVAEQIKKGGQNARISQEKIPVPAARRGNGPDRRNHRKP